MTTVLALVNGEKCDAVSVRDRGLQYGDGVFETIAVENGQALCLQDHLARLRSGCERLGIDTPALEEMISEIRSVCAGQETGVCKFIVTRAAGTRGYRPTPGTANRIVLMYPGREHMHKTGPARIQTCQTRLGRNPALAGIKHLNRLEQVLAQAELEKGSYDEGVMLDSEGLVIEATMSNLFAVSDGGLVTPDLSCCGVAGILRAQVLALAREVTGKSCEVRDVVPEELAACDEIFLSNSIREIWPVGELDGRVLVTGTVTGAMQTAVHRLRREGRELR